MTVIYLFYVYPGADASPGPERVDGRFGRPACEGVRLLALLGRPDAGPQAGTERHGLPRRRGNALSKLLRMKFKVKELF